MAVKEISNKEIWENFISQCQEKTFLSSWNWGEFNRMMSNKIWRLGIYHNEQKTTDNEQLVGLALVVKVVARRGTFLFVLHGPVLRNSAGNPESEIQNSKFIILNTLLQELRKIASEENISFIRFSPILERTEENVKIFKDLGFREAPLHMHPELTWELDISPSEEEILARMRKTTRYLIRRAEKDSDIEIVQTQSREDVEKFNRLYQETKERHHFAPFLLDYLESQFLAFQSDHQIVIFLGKYKGEIVSSAIIVFWSGRGFYHHGASSQKFSKIPVSYLLQWEAIKEAKRRGCKIYNFWGIAPDNNKNHPWAGLTLFKMGFGGYKKEYLKTQDLPLSWKYWLNYLVEKGRRKKRGL